MAEPKNIKVIVTNISGGPKVLNSIPPGLLAAGDSTDDPVEMTEAEVESAKATGWFKFGAAAAKQASKEADAKDD